MHSYSDMFQRLDKRFFGMPEYLQELVIFYKEFIPGEKELEEFIVSIMSFEYKPGLEQNKPRVMINTIMRLVKLADDMEKIRPGKDVIKVLFIVICIEALYKIAEINIRKKYKIVIDFFEKYISEDDKKYILENVERSLADKRYEVNKRKDETQKEYMIRLDEEVDESFSTKITIEVFARIITTTRNIFAHEGNYYSFTPFSSADYPLVENLEVSENDGEQKKLRVYEFSLDYNHFRFICTKAFISFVKRYIDEQS